MRIFRYLPILLVAFCVCEQRVVNKIFTDMGALNETPGQFGAAHFLEHLMFKGTTTLGSLDWEREKGLHEQIHAAEDALIEELNRSRNDLRQRGVFHDYQHSETTPRIDELRALIDSLNGQVQELSEEGPVSVWYMAYGGTGLTATTEQEYMKFDIDLPVDRVDLFLRLEADRMQNSIFRNFDAERMVLVEQRLGDLNRADTEFREAMNSLVGRASMVYVPEGYTNDFQQYTRRYERELYETYFVPNNTTIIFIGGVTVEKYFGHMERAPEPKRYQGREPLPSAEKRLTWRSDTLTPRVEIRYQIPGVGHPDRPQFDVLAESFEAYLQSAITEAGVDGTVDVRCWPSCDDSVRSHCRPTWLRRRGRGYALRGTERPNTSSATTARSALSFPRRRNNEEFDRARRVVCNAVLIAGPDTSA
jgi:predicted Zn-dependent peptidase